MFVVPRLASLSTLLLYYYELYCCISMFDKLIKCKSKIKSKYSFGFSGLGKKLENFNQLLQLTSCNLKFKFSCCRSRTERENTEWCSNQVLSSVLTPPWSFCSS